MKRLTRGLAGNVAVGIAYVLLLFLRWQGHPDITGEARLMENLQAAALFGALVLSLAGLLLFRRGFPPYIGSGLAVISLSLLLRELDVEKLDLPAVVVSLGSGRGKWLLLGLLWSALIVAVANNARRLKADLRACLGSPLGRYLLAGALFYLASDLFDKKMFPLEKSLSVFCEEALECLATLYFLLGVAFWSAAGWRRARAGDDSEKGGAGDDEIR